MKYLPIKIPLPCANKKCGKLFVQKDWRQKYCSSVCQITRSKAKTKYKTSPRR